jgi:hypothetical protein
VSFQALPQEDYRRHAAECLRVAAEVTDAQSKRALTFVAHAWLRIAEHAERNTIEAPTMFTRPKPDEERSKPDEERSDAEALKLLLKKLKETEVADLDPRVGQRIGELIARAVFDPSKPYV